MAPSSILKKTVLLLGVLAVFPFPITFAFSDVPQGSKYFAAIENLKAQGIINGYPDGTFQPAKTINRAEAVKLVILAQKILQPTIASGNYPEIMYPDVLKSDWFFDFVKIASGKKIVEGYPDKNFRPATTINAVESLKIILLGFDAKTDSVRIEGNPYPDVSALEWYAPYVNFAQKKQLIEPKDDGNYEPSHEMTRGEFSEIIYRLVYLQQNTLEVFPISLNWPSFNDPQGNYTLHFPMNWLAMDAGTNTVFWKQDIANQQMSFARIAPNSGVLIGAVDENLEKKSLADYVDGLKLDASATKQFLTLNTLPFASVNFADKNLQNYYFELPNGKVASFFAHIGDGDLNPQLKQEIRYILGSVRTGIDPQAVTNTVTSTTPTVDTPTTSVSTDLGEQTLSQVREKILVQGQGKATLKVFTDLIITETDSLGVGTGPIDYYYSAQFSVSIKYERNSDTILALKDGKTNAF